MREFWLLRKDIDCGVRRYFCCLKLLQLKAVAKLNSLNKDFARAIYLLECRVNYIAKTKIRKLK